METVLNMFIRALESNDIKEAKRIIDNDKYALIEELKEAKEKAYAHSQVKMLFGALQGWVNV